MRFMFNQNHFKCVLLLVFAGQLTAAEYTAEQLRDLYSQPVNVWPKAMIDEGVEFKEIGLLGEVVFPDDNSFSAAKLTLGKKLFNDGRLSRSEQIACASCHDRDLAWADGRKKSFGHNRQQGKRNAPTVENIAYSEHFFWDGRASTLEQQALMPIQDPLEMNFTLTELTLRLEAVVEYRKLFKEAFGDEKVTVDRIAKALATFQRTVTSRKSDFDYFMMAAEQGSERTKALYRNKLSDQALRGMHLFRTKARCINCHSGPNFSDQKFHNIGLTYYKRKHQDLGRYHVTKNTDDVGKFKTPSLRGVLNTGPWMHNGLFVDLKGILNLYNAGVSFPKHDPSDPMSPKLSPHIKPLNLSRDEIAALEAFLSSITARPSQGPARQFITSK